MTTPRVYSRAGWRARPPAAPIQVLDHAPDHVVVHHTASPNTTGTTLSDAFALSEWIQRLHMDDRGWDDAGQHLTISRGGHVMEGREQTLTSITERRLVHGAQVLHENSHTIGIENEGTYLTAPVPAALWLSLVNTCAWLCRTYGLDPAVAIVGHRDYNDTECPGDVLYARLPRLRASVAHVLDLRPRKAELPPPPPLDLRPRKAPAFPAPLEVGLPPPPPMDRG
jgi:hypothetical protein